MKKLLLLMMASSFFTTQVLYAQAKPKTATTAKPTAAAKKPAAAPAKATPAAEPEITPVASVDGKEVVAIYPFTTASGYDYEYAQSVGNAVESGFVRSTRFVVVERTRFGSIKGEERFKEVNTSEVVRTASKFGAKYIVVGHITGATTGKIYDTQGKFAGYQTSISVAFKIIDVQTGQIKITESLNLAGSGGSTASSVGDAYASIDGVTRRIIAAYFPQRFPFMAIVAKEAKKKGEQLTSFKIWGGSDHGLKAGDMVEVYLLSEIVNPVTKARIEEKQFVGAAQVAAINSTTTSTCTVFRPNKYGKPMLDVIQGSPDKIVIEFTGGARPKSFWENL